jgi:predicted transcriptional regulator
LKRSARIEGRSLSATERTVAAVRVYEELLTLARLNRGKVIPTMTIAEATALGRATVARGLQALDTAGFLVRQRRVRCGSRR